MGTSVCRHKSDTNTFKRIISAVSQVLYLVQREALTANLNNNVSGSIRGHTPAIPEKQHD
jgi:hypothetical protein